MYKREYYLKLLREVYYQNSCIKFLYGLRRCGKTVLIRQIEEELLDNGINKEHILFFDFDSLEYENLSNAFDLINYIKNIVQDRDTYYVFLDEIQKIVHFEEVIKTLHFNKQFNLFVSTSSSKDFFSDRTNPFEKNMISLEIQPFSFLEVLDIKKTTKKNYKDLLFSIFEWGTMPARFLFSGEFEKKNYLLDTVDSTLLYEVVSSLKLSDVGALNKILQYMIETEGSSFSATAILEYLKMEGYSVATDTLYKYLNALCSSYLLHKVERYDIENKQTLKTLSKYYIADFGLRKVKANRTLDYSVCFENLIYNELVRKGYFVATGKIGKETISFVATKKDTTKYIECCLSLSKEDVFKIAEKFKTIDDASLKYIITMDESGLPLDDVRCISIFTFLMDADF